MSKPVLLYDADCGFCRWALDKLLRWDRRRAVRTVALQSAEADELLKGMDPDKKMASWHLVVEGRVYSEGDVAPHLLRILPAGKPLAPLFASFPRTTNRLYRHVARNRERYGRMLGEKACSVDPGRR